MGRRVLLPLALLTVYVELGHQRPYIINTWIGATSQLGVEQVRVPRLVDTQHEECRDQVIRQDVTRVGGVS